MHVFYARSPLLKTFPLSNWLFQQCTVATRKIHIHAHTNVWIIDICRQFEESYIYCLKYKSIFIKQYWVIARLQIEKKTRTNKANETHQISISFWNILKIYYVSFIAMDKKSRNFDQQLPFKCIFMLM